MVLISIRCWRIAWMSQIFLSCCSDLESNAIFNFSGRRKSNVFFSSVLAIRQQYSLIQRGASVVEKCLVCLFFGRLSWCVLFIWNLRETNKILLCCGIFHYAHFFLEVIKMRSNFPASRFVPSWELIFLMYSSNLYVKTLHWNGRPLWVSKYALFPTLVRSFTEYRIVIITSNQIKTISNKVKIICMVFRSQFSNFLNSFDRKTRPNVENAIELGK